MTGISRMEELKHLEMVFEHMLYLYVEHILADGNANQYRSNSVH
jgi:hypothetical protein